MLGLEVIAELYVSKLNLALALVSLDMASGVCLRSRSSPAILDVVVETEVILEEERLRL